jgi:hypothetical protein
VAGPAATYPGNGAAEREKALLFTHAIMQYYLSPVNRGNIKGDYQVGHGALQVYGSLTPKIATLQILIVIKFFILKKG